MQREHRQRGVRSGAERAATSQDGVRGKERQSPALHFRSLSPALITGTAE